tara:strand:+ start:202 stop:330 length:129 start_codon:yes stop_codon:yes gene_type:complete
MIKNILILLFCCVVVSCGKKGDPIYKDSKSKTSTQIINENRI